MNVTSETVVLIAGLNSADDTDSSSDVVFHLANNSDEAMTILIWNSPFEQILSADVFTITLDGVPVAYQGRKVKRSAPGVRDYMRIPARERVEVVVDIAAYYDMVATGEYRVRFTPLLVGGQTHLNMQTPVQVEESVVTIRSAQP